MSWVTFDHLFRSQSSKIFWAEMARKQSLMLLYAHPLNSVKQLGYDGVYPTNQHETISRLFMILGATFSEWWSSEPVVVVYCTNFRGAVHSTDILGPILHLLGPYVPPTWSRFSEPFPCRCLRTHKDELSGSVNGNGLAISSGGINNLPHTNCSYGGKLGEYRQMRWDRLF